MRIITAAVKYALNVLGTSVQLRYNHEATTNLDTSKMPPMIIIGTTAAANIAVSPAIEYHAAIQLSDIAAANITLVITLSFIFFLI